MLGVCPAAGRFLHEFLASLVQRRVLPSSRIRIAGRMRATDAHRFSDFYQFPAWDGADDVPEDLDQKELNRDQRSEKLVPTQSL